MTTILYPSDTVILKHRYISKVNYISYLLYSLCAVSKLGIGKCLSLEDCSAEVNIVGLIYILVNL